MSKKRELQVLVLGCESGGKSLLVKQLRNSCKRKPELDTIFETSPTVGMEREFIEISQRKCMLRELGGSMAPVWSKYFTGTCAVLFVVDGSNPAQSGSVLCELLGIINGELSKTPLCVVLNKSDVSTCLSLHELKAVLLLESIEKDHENNLGGLLTPVQSQEFKLVPFVMETSGAYSDEATTYSITKELKMDTETNTLDAQENGDSRQIKFSSALERTIAEVLPTDDPLESPYFNVVEYVNKLFPNEQSLSNVDHTVLKLKQQIRKSDEDILDAVREQSRGGEQGRKDLSEAITAIKELNSRISDIKSQAEESEQMVQEICRDIKSLDYAKKNLTTTITAMKRLHMLVTGVDQLSEMSTRRQYREAASMYEAVTQLLAHFEPYRAVKRVNDLGQKVDKVRAGLRLRVLEEFEDLHVIADGLNQSSPSTLPGRSWSTVGTVTDIGGAGMPHATSDRLHEACFLADALGSHVRVELAEKYYVPIMHEYRSIFHPSGEGGQLDSASRRFSWLKKQFRVFETHYSTIFPANWWVLEKLCEEFCRDTRTALSNMLDEASNKGGLDVTLLLHVLNKTMELEKELSRRFRRNVKSVGREEGEEEEGEEEEEETPPVDTSSAAFIKWKYKQHQIKQRKEEKRKVREEKASSKNGKMDEMEEENKAVAGNPVEFSGLMSQAFEPYLHLYLAQEDKNIQDLLDRVAKDDTAKIKEHLSSDKSESSAMLRVLPSSTELFIYFKASLSRCRVLSGGQTLFGLYKLFQKFLKFYSEVLIGKLPKANSSAVSLAMALSGDRAGDNKDREDKLSRLPLSDEDITMICMVINTSEYCFETITQLGDSVKGIIDSAYGEDIDLTPEQDLYSTVIGKSVRTLVQGIATKIEPAMISMTKMPWGTWDTVGDQSDYVNAVSVAIQQTIPTISTLLSPLYFRFFCDKFVADFIPRFISSIYKCKRISEVGASQILLDTQALKTLLLDMPSIHATGSVTDMSVRTASAASAPTAGYTRFVNNEMGRADSLLKVVCTPPESLTDSYKALISDGSESNFAKIMELKGMKKTDQQEFMDKFVKGGKHIKKLFEKFS